MEGSSNTYSTPVVLLRTALANCIRCRSPVERLEAALSRVRYPSPRSSSRLAVSWKDSHMLPAMDLISSGRESGTPSTHLDTSLSVMAQT